MKIPAINEKIMSISKIQSDWVEYIYRGTNSDGRHILESTTDDRMNDCIVDAEWFENRKIKQSDHD